MRPSRSTVTARSADSRAPSSRSTWAEVTKGRSAARTTTAYGRDAVGGRRQGLDGGGQAGHGTAAGHALEHDAYALGDALARADDERRAVAGGIEHARDERSTTHVEHRLVRAHAP